MTKTKKYKGTFRIIWHNSTFTPYKSGDMWKEIFLTILKESSI